MSDAAPEPTAPKPNIGAPIPEKPKPDKETPPHSPPRGMPRIAYWLLAILAIALGAVGTESTWMPALQPYLPGQPATNNEAQLPLPAQPVAKSDAQPALDARLDAMERRLAGLSALSDRIGALERRPTPDATAAIAPLEARLQQLNARLDDIEARLAQLAKDQTNRGDSAQRVLIVALSDLGSALASSAPFAAQLASVEALGQNRPGWVTSLHPLEDAAKTGLPSKAILAQRFSGEVAPAILRAEAAAPHPQASIGDAVLAKLRALVVIRRTDGESTSADPIEAAVATAEAALAKGDLTAAVEAVNALGGAPKEAAAAWLQAAQQRLEAEQIVAKLTQSIAADLAAAPSGG